MKPMRVLFIVEQCHPYLASVPLLGYHFFRELDKRIEVTLCTHGRNKAALSAVHKKSNILFFEESLFSRYYYKCLSPLTLLGGSNWPLMHALFYPIYAEFNRNVYKALRQQVEQGAYDIVHVFTPIIPRYPSKMIEACQHTPFVLGPVNGGLPFPKGFGKIGLQEFSYLNFLRSLTHLIPGYKKTYEKADRILAGSTYTLNMLKDRFPHNVQNMELFCENGLTEDFFHPPVKRKSLNDPLHLLFVGRLVPYKCADLILQALSLLPDDCKAKVFLTIIGDGPEKSRLQAMAQNLHLIERVEFKGWIPNTEVHTYYSQADVFCFPSIREFGGAVVLEAMASGLPCLVVDYGGVGEYVTTEAGFKIAPISKEHIVLELTKGILAFLENPHLRQEMGQAAFRRAQAFSWEHKIEHLLAIYSSLLEGK